MQVANRVFYIVSSVFAIACFMSVDAQSQTPRAWLARGIGGGGALYSPSISPFDPNRIYMATDMTGVFRSTDFGTNWQTLPFLQLRGGVDTQVRFTSNPNVLYAIKIGFFGERMAVRSGNGGGTFLALAGDPALGETFTLFADPNTQNRLILATWDKLYFSNTSGQTFSMIFDANDPNNGVHLAGVFWDGGRIFVGTNKGLLFSNNNGASFALNSIAGLPANESLVSMAGAKTGTQIRLIGVTLPAGNVWGGITGAEIVDSGNTARVYRLNFGAGPWARVRNSNFPDKPFFVGMSQTNINSVYLAGHNSQNGRPSVLKSSDGGTSWAPTLQTQNNQNIATGWMGDGGDLAWSWSETALGFAVSPTDPNRLIVTDYGFAHVSDNGGTSWRQVYVRPNYQNAAGASTPTGRAYASSGIEQTSCWWLHWASSQSVIAGFSDIRGIQSRNAGLSWIAGSSAGLPHNSTYHVVEHPVSGTLFAATSTVHDLYQSTYLQDSRIDGGTGMIVVSTNDGNTWQPFFDFGHPVVWLAFDPTNSNKMYACVVHSTAGGIYMTQNLSSPTGPTFQKLANPPRTQGHPMCLRILSDGTLVSSWSGRRDAAGSFTTSSGVFISTNGGQSWTDRSDANLQRWTKDIVIDPHDPQQNTWYAAVFSHWGSFPNEVGGLYRTSNRGVAWQEIGNFYRVESVSVDPANPDLAYVTTEADGLWITNNLRSATPTFQLDRSYPFQHPTRVFFNPFLPSQVWATSFGGGLRLLRPEQP